MSDMEFQINDEKEVAVVEQSEQINEENIIEVLE